MVVAVGLGVGVAETEGDEAAVGDGEIFGAALGDGLDVGVTAAVIFVFTSSSNFFSSEKIGPRRAVST